LAAISHRVQTVGLRADAWWAHLAEWKPAGPLVTAQAGAR
jgi:hypothetical protein